MAKEKPNDRFIGVEEMQELLGGVSKSKAYSIIQTLNRELKANGKITIAGRVSRPYALYRLGIMEEERYENISKRNISVHRGVAAR